MTDFPVLATEKNSFYVSLLLKTKQNYRTAHGCETRGATPGWHTFDLRKTFSPYLRTWSLHFTSRNIIIHPNTLFLLYNHIFKTKCWQKSRTWKQKLFRIRWLFESRILACVCVWRSFYFFQIASHLRSRFWNLLMRDATRISALVKNRAKYMLMWFWFSASIWKVIRNTSKTRPSCHPACISSGLTGDLSIKIQPIQILLLGVWLWAMKHIYMMVRAWTKHLNQWHI